MIFNANISKRESDVNLSDATATSSDILSGKTAYGASGKIVGTLIPGTDTSDATATAADIVSGKTAYVVSGKVTGTLTELSNPDFLPIYPVNITVINNTEVPLAIHSHYPFKYSIGAYSKNIASGETGSFSGYSGYLVIFSQGYHGIFNVASTSDFFYMISYTSGNPTDGSEAVLTSLYPKSPNLSCTITVT